MEFNCNKGDLLEAVSKVEKIVSSKTTLPIIGNILFEAKKGKIKLSANDLEMGVELSFLATVVKEGSILIPAKTLSGIVNKLPDGNISFKVDEKGLVKISYKKSNFNIHGLPADEFPSLPAVKEEKVVLIDPELFMNMAKQTLFSVSSNEDKFVLNGILMELGISKNVGDASNFRMIATDGYRLAKRGATIEGLDVADTKMIVPGKAVNELLRLIQNSTGEDKIEIAFSNDQIAFRYKSAYLVSRLIQGQFPDYKQVIPKSSHTKVLLERRVLLESVERAAVIASSAANIMRFDIKPGKLHIIAVAPEVGNIDEVLEVNVKGQEKGQVSFNVRLILEALKNMEEAELILEVSGPLAPGVIRPSGNSDYLYIVMPIRTQEVAA